MCRARNYERGNVASSALKKNGAQRSSTFAVGRQNYVHRVECHFNAGILLLRRLSFVTAWILEPEAHMHSSVPSLCRTPRTFLDHSLHRLAFGRNRSCRLMTVVFRCAAHTSAIYKSVARPETSPHQNIFIVTFVVVTLAVVKFRPFPKLPDCVVKSDTSPRLLIRPRRNSTCLYAALGAYLDE